MTTYLVAWEIDIDADSPEEAAQKAFEIQRNPDSIATCFKVRKRNISGLPSVLATKIDLGEVGFNVKDL